MQNSHFLRVKYAKNQINTTTDSIGKMPVGTVTGLTPLYVSAQASQYWLTAQMHT